MERIDQGEYEALLDFGQFPELVDGLALVNHLCNAAHLLLFGQHLSDHGFQLLSLERDAVLRVLGLDRISSLLLDFLSLHIDFMLVNDVVLDDLPLDALGVSVNSDSISSAVMGFSLAI